MSNNNCGCAPQVPAPTCNSAQLIVPIQQLLAETAPVCPQTSASFLYFATTTSGFVVPPTGGVSVTQVADGSKFAAGQWVQFVNPTGTFRIISITGNNLTLSNATPDGVSAIEGNPVPPTQYPIGAAFVSVSQPVQITMAQFNAKVQDAIKLLTTISIDGIAVQGSAEKIYLLGFLKSDMCNNVAQSCELRKVRTDGPYIDETGKVIFPSGVESPFFKIPVPTGGIPAQNAVALNPNSGTGGGFLISFINPSTGVTTYVDLFSGKANDKIYNVKLTTSGTIELVESEFRSRLAIHPNPEAPSVRIRGGQFDYGSGTTEDTYGLRLTNTPATGVCDITITEPFKPTWATHHILRIMLDYNPPVGELLEIYAGGKLMYQMMYRNSDQVSHHIDLVVPVLTTSLQFKLYDLTNASPNSYSGADHNCRIMSKGYASYEYTSQPA